MAAGLAMSKLLPANSKLKILVVNNRLLFAIANAAFFAIVEIFLVMTLTFVWVYPWWVALQVFVLVCIPFFLVTFYCYDWKPRKQAAFIGSVFGVDAVMLVLFASGLRWI